MAKLIDVVYPKIKVWSTQRLRSIFGCTVGKCAREKIPMYVPVTQVTLKGKQVLIETLNGLLLQHIVDAVPTVQHPDFHLGLLFSLWLRTV